MKYLNIEIGSREVQLFVAEIVESNFYHKCVHRAKINTVYSGQTLSIDVTKLLADITSGLREAGAVDAVTVTGSPTSLVILDESDNMLFPTLSVRDEKIDRVSDDAIDLAQLYMESALVPCRRSVLYQLLAFKGEDEELFKRAECFMFLTDYVKFVLTGVKSTDYSMANASALTLSGKRKWNDELFARLEIENLFPSIAEDDEVIGSFTETVSKDCGYVAEVYSTSSNSIVVATKLLSPTMLVTSYMNGGIGRAFEEMIVNEEIFTSNGRTLNPGDGSIVLLPFEGYAIIEKVKLQMQEGTTFDTIENIARENKVFEYVDIRDDRLKKANVFASLNEILDEEGKEKVDRDVAIGLLYNSIARFTVGSMRLLDDMAGSTSDEVYILGYGARDYYINSLIAMHSGKKVIASRGFFSSVFASLYLMMVKGEVEKGDVLSLIRTSYGLTSFARKEE